jgi:hypothetical protein
MINFDQKRAAKWYHPCDLAARKNSKEGKSCPIIQIVALLKRPARAGKCIRDISAGCLRWDCWRKFTISPAARP